jgi:hypothetical protein
MNILLVMIKLLYYFSSQDGGKLRDSVLKGLIQLLIVVKSKVTYVDKTSDF